MIRQKMRKIRKRIWRVSENTDLLSRVLTQNALIAYRIFDNIFLRRWSRPDLGSEKYIMHDVGIIYVGVPKVATRSLLNALAAVPNVDAASRRFVEADMQTTTMRVPAFRDYFLFTFVRNPWSRIASCYRDKILNPHPVKQARHLRNRYGLVAGMPFGEFLEWLCSPYGSDDIADRHWMSQYRLLGLDMQNPPTYDFVGRFENLAGDFVKLGQMCGIELPPLPHKLETGAAGEYQQMFTDKDIELVANRYKRDIVEFGYSFS